jgi:uncharacterized membrane protein
MSASSSWDEFQVRKAAAAPSDVALEPAVSKPRKRRPGAKETALADLLLEAVTLASGRRGRITRAQSVREQTLLEVLSTAMRSAR